MRNVFLGLVVVVLTCASCRGDESHIMPGTYEFTAEYVMPEEEAMVEVCGIYPLLIGTGYPEYIYYVDIGWDQTECVEILRISRTTEMDFVVLNENIEMEVLNCAIQGGRVLVTSPNAPSCEMEFDLIGLE